MLAGIGIFYLVGLAISIVSQLRYKRKVEKARKEYLDAFKNALQQAKERYSMPDSIQQLKHNREIDVGKILRKRKKFFKDETNRILDDWEKEHPNWRDKLK
jgi:hypothetical protein